MKRVIMVVLVMAVCGFAWSATNETAAKEDSRLQTRTKTEDQAQDQQKIKDQLRTKEELKLREQLKSKLSETDCDKLMNQVKEKAKTENKYQETLAFMNAYMKRNKNVKDSEKLNAVAGFYCEQETSVNGSPAEKRNKLMVKAENMVKSEAKNQKMISAQTKEGTQEMNQNRYQKKLGKEGENSDSRKKTDVDGTGSSANSKR